MNITINCDGGSRGNPGPSASAFVAKDEKQKVIHEDSKYLGINTNNFAEYQAVIMALEWLTSKLDVDSVIFYLDSELVVKQIKGIYKIKSESLKPLLVNIHKLIKELNIKINFQNVPRVENSIADSLVNQTLDSSSQS